MSDLGDIFRAVCHIESDVNGWTIGGNGTFIAPDRVLTNWHILKKMRTPLFTNSDGRTAGPKNDAWDRQTGERDIVVIDLDTPIGERICPLPMDVPEHGVKGHLITRFHNLAAAHEVSLTKARQDRLSVFDGNTEARRGYSGSPIIDGRGRLLSIAIAKFANLEHWQKNVAGDIELKGKYQFLGTPPEDLTAFCGKISRGPL